MWHGILKDAIPVLRNFALSLFQRQAPRADFGVQIALDAIFGVGAAVGNGSFKRFGPEISGIGGIAAEFERNEMVFLIIPQARIGVAVLSDLLNLQPVGVVLVRTNGPGAPARIANRLTNIL